MVSNINTTPPEAATRQQIDWILFDCDGVLVDSEAVVLEVLIARFGAVLGAAIDVEPELRNLLGLPLAEIAVDIGRRYDRTFDAAWVHDVHLGIQQELRALTEAMPDVKWAIDQIDLARAVVSNSDLTRLHGTLDRAGLTRYFGDAVYSAEQVTRPKPAPDLYRHALAQLGTQPERCLVVEDSAVGVQAAVAAGLTVIGFTGAGHLPAGHAGTQMALGAATSIATMRELPEVVARFATAGADAARNTTTRS